MLRVTPYLKASVIALTALTLSVLVVPAAWSQNTPNPALWKISDEDSNIYLFGTIHILNPELEWRNEKIDAAFGASKTVVFEAPADTSNSANMQALVLRYGVNTGGSKLSEKISVDSYQLLKTTLQNFGMPPGSVANFEPLRPWLVGLTVTALHIQAHGGDPNAGVEKVLGRAAAANNMSVAYLETDEQQMQIFSGLSAEAERFFLEDGLKQIQGNPEMLDEMVSVWRSGDIVALEEMLFASLIEQPELYDAMFTKRNEDWANQIEQMLAGSGDIFIAVGAAHLVGADSVQELLEEKGITAVRQ